MIKIKLKHRPAATTVDEVAKWRKTSFNTEFTPEELQRLIDTHGADVLGAHYDDGVPTGKDTGMIGGAVAVSGQEIRPRSRETTEPQKSFNPRAKWETPAGIYYYPISWAKDKIFDTGVPFAGSSKYIYIYKIKDVSKRIDALDLCKNGFIEKALLWTAKNANLPLVLTNSNVSNKAYTEILDYYGGGVAFGDPSKSPEDNVYSAFLTYLSRNKESVRWFINDRFLAMGATFLPTNVFMDSLTKSFAQQVNRGLGEMLSANDKTVPSFVFQRDVWMKASERFLKDLKVDSIFEKMKGLSRIDNRFSDLLDALKASIDYNHININPNDLLKRRQLPPKTEGPMPDGSFEKLLKADGKSDAQIANMCFYVINNMMGRNVNRVTKYFISEGYEVFEDREGTSTIHGSEPYQGIYLTTRIIDLVGVYLNRFRAGRMKPSYLNPKQMDPALLRKMLASDKGKAFVDRAFRYAREDDPKELEMFLQYIFRNTDIPKDKALADKIEKNADIRNLSFYSIARFIEAFAPVFKPQELEDRLSRLVVGDVKSSIDAESIANGSRVFEFFKDAVETLDIEYGPRFDFSKYPTLSFINEIYEAVKADDRMTEIITNMDLYNIDDLKKYFPSMLKIKTVSGPIALDVLVSNIIESSQFKNRPIEDRMNFNEWLFETYPQSWKDDKVIRSALSSMRYVREQDDATPKAEELFNKKLEEGFYGKLLAHWEEMKKDPELMARLAREREEINKKYGKPQGVTTENRFKKLNRIGRYSMIR